MCVLCVCRPLLQRDQLLQGVELLETADYACLVISSSRSSSGSSGSSDGILVQPGYTVLYANRAARDVLLLMLQHDQQQQQQQQQQLLQTLQVVPPAVAGLLQSITQQQQQQCVLLQEVTWSAEDGSSPEQQQQQQQQQHVLHVPHLLCVPLLSPNGEPHSFPSPRTTLFPDEPHNCNTLMHQDNHAPCNPQQG